MRLFLILLALGIVTAVRADAPPGSIDDFISAEMAVSDVPGLAYAIVENGEFQSDAYGEVLIGSGRLVTPDTPFLLGSISKSFTAMAVMQLVEAGKAFGASRMKLLMKVELPAALPSIMAGVTQCIMLSLSMVVIAALVGADGLGKPVVRALNTVNISQGFEAGLAIVLVAIILDRLCKTPNQKEA